MTTKARNYVVLHHGKPAKDYEATMLWRVRALMFLGGKCARCGFNDMRALQIDHVNGDGAKHRREITSHNSLAMSRYVIENPKMFQVLCANCNWIKRYERHEHTLRRDAPVMEEA